MDRRWAPWPGRRPQALRLAGCPTVEAANRVPREPGGPGHPATWTGPAQGDGTACVPSPGGPLDRIGALQPARAVGHEHGVPVGTRRLPLPQAAWRSRVAHCRGTVDDHLDGTRSLGHGPHPVGHEAAAGRRFPPASQAVGQAA
jgi:hypothetical protein